MFSTGDDGLLAGPLVILATAWLTNQTARVKVVTGEHNDHPRLSVTVMPSWTPPALSFAGIVWILCQVSSSMQ